jgi:hypothetical protein
VSVFLFFVFSVVQFARVLTIFFFFCPPQSRLLRERRSAVSLETDAVFAACARVYDPPRDTKDPVRYVVDAVRESEGGEIVLVTGEPGAGATTAFATAVHRLIRRDDGDRETDDDVEIEGRCGFFFFFFSFFFQFFFFLIFFSHSFF